MVLKCTHYTTSFPLNVSQTGCTIASQLGFEPGLLVWQAGSLPIKPSGLARIYKVENYIATKSHQNTRRLFLYSNVNFCPFHHRSINLTFSEEKSRRRQCKKICSSMALTHSPSIENIPNQNEIFYTTSNFSKESVSSSENQPFLNLMRHKFFETVSV